MENEVKENNNSSVQPEKTTVNKSYKTHFIVTLIILIGLVIYTFSSSKGVRDLPLSPKRPVPEFSTGEIKATITTNDGRQIEVTSNKDEKGKEEIKASTTIVDGNMSIKINSERKEGEPNVQVNVE